MKKNKLAVSAIFHKRGTIYTITRANHLKAFPGYTSFPGGKVDKEDHAQNFSETLRKTLEREMQEELGIDLKELERVGVIANIKQVAKATSPNFNPYIYETYFYLIELTEEVTFIEDAGEIAESFWSTPAEILNKFNTGSLLMIYPIRKFIEELSLGNTDYIDFDQQRDLDIPMIEPKKNLLQIMPTSNTLPPATRTNAFLIGDKRKILIDPSPGSEQEYLKLKKTLSMFDIENILLTHHHGDHHENAPRLARELAVPILISSDSYERCLKVFGKNYFESCLVQFLSEGDQVTSWLGSPVKIYEVPGHDEGHLALAPDSMEWSIVGDLFQGVGTVVVGGDEGNMIKYFESLKKIIALNPKCVIPSHGIALGGTNILQKNLKHRELREEQIRDLFKLGKTKEEILATIYFELPAELKRYAMANIDSHLEKLSLEGRLD